MTVFVSGGAKCGKSSLAQDLSKEAQQVSRIFCGLEQKLK